MQQQRISPDYEPHITLEKRVADYLKAHQFTTDSATYHTAYQLGTQALLMRNYTATALYIRSKADRIAIHQYKAIVFEWDVKTHENQNRQNWALEVMPLVSHLATVPLGVRCLFVYHNPFTRFECGFWTDAMPPIMRIHLPPRWKGEIRTRYAALIERYFPNVPINEEFVGGSGDPFVLFGWSVVRQLPHWQTLIDAELTKDIAS